ncbi:MAG: 2-amino-4-hydroxy-6-hydroxymethyldihydropteridine diphosphokinase [Dehalobacterium sp.]
MKTNLVYLSLGSNMGNKKEYLSQALKYLKEVPTIRITRKSSLYQTDPVGYVEQDYFLNAVLELETSLEPETLLKTTQEIENKLNRKRTIRWGPRTIDIDLLLFNDQIISTPDLVIPHAQMHLRRFVLVPLAELDPKIFIPGVGQVEQIVASCADQGRVSRVYQASEW